MAHSTFNKPCEYQVKLDKGVRSIVLDSDYPFYRPMEFVENSYVFYEFQTRQVDDYWPKKELNGENLYWWPIEERESFVTIRCILPITESPLDYWTNICLSYEPKIEQLDQNDIGRTEIYPHPQWLMKKEDTDDGAVDGFIKIPAKNLQKHPKLLQKLEAEEPWEFSMVLLRYPKDPSEIIAIRGSQAGKEEFAEYLLEKFLNPENDSIYISEVPCCGAGVKIGPYLTEVQQLIQKKIGAIQKKIQGGTENADI